MAETTVASNMFDDQFVQDSNYNITETSMGPNISDNEILQQYYNELHNAKLPATVICAVVLVIGLIGNSLTLYVFVFHYTKGKFRYFIIFLTLADLFSCLTAVPVEMASHLYEYPVPYICKIKAFLWAFTLYLKPTCMAIISVDRYRKVCHPFGWQMRQTTAVRACIGVYILATLLALPVPILWKIAEQEVEYMNRNITVTVCDVDVSYEDPFIDKYIPITFILVAIALGCMEWVYLHVFTKLVRWKRVVYQRSMKKKFDAYGTEEEMDTNPSTDALTVGNISSDHGPYIASDTEQTHVAGEDGSHSHNKKIEDELNIIYLARRTVVIMMYLTLISFIITLTHIATTGHESNGIAPSLNLIGNVINPVVYILRDSEYRVGIMQLKKCCGCFK